MPLLGQKGAVAQVATDQQVELAQPTVDSHRIQDEEVELVQSHQRGELTVVDRQELPLLPVDDREQYDNRLGNRSRPSPKIYSSTSTT